MDPVHVVEVKEAVLADNEAAAQLNREKMKEQGAVLVNLMGSPGAGKTSTLLQLIRRLKDAFRIAVMEADVDSDVDAKTIAETGVRVIQLHTAGLCHMDADMTRRGLEAMGTEDLDLILKEIGLKIDAVINLNIEDDELIKRITGRRLCPTCGEIFNIYYKAPAKEGICDKCGAELITRKDDNLESLTVRLQEYHKNTQPVIEYYEKAGLVANVDAKQGVDEVFGDIRKLLEGLC